MSLHAKVAAVRPAASQPRVSVASGGIGQAPGPAGAGLRGVGLAGARVMGFSG